MRVAQIPITPEERLSRRLRGIRILCAVLVACVLLFVVLYIQQRAVTQESYRQVFADSVHEAAVAMQDYAADAFDGRTKYLTATAALNTAREMLFLTDELEERQTCMNELYTACLKFPEQMSARFAETAEAMDRIDSGDAKEADAGYAALNEIVSSLDKLGR